MGEEIYHLYCDKCKNPVSATSSNFCPKCGSEELDVIEEDSIDTPYEVRVQQHLTGFRKEFEGYEEEFRELLGRGVSPRVAKATFYYVLNDYSTQKGSGQRYGVTGASVKKNFRKVEELTGQKASTKRRLSDLTMETVEEEAEEFDEKEHKEAFKKMLNKGFSINVSKAAIAYVLDDDIDQKEAAERYDVSQASVGRTYHLAEEELGKEVTRQKESGSKNKYSNKSLEDRKDIGFLKVDKDAVERHYQLNYNDTSLKDVLQNLREIYEEKGKVTKLYLSRYGEKDVNVYVGNQRTPSFSILKALAGLPVHQPKVANQKFVEDISYGIPEDFDYKVNGGKEK